MVGGAFVCPVTDPLPCAAMTTTTRAPKTPRACTRCQARKLATICIYSQHGTADHAETVLCPRCIARAQADGAMAVSMFTSPTEELLPDATVTVTDDYSLVTLMMGYSRLMEDLFAGQFDALDKELGYESSTPLRHALILEYRRQADIREKYVPL